MDINVYCLLKCVHREKAKIQAESFWIFISWYIVCPHVPLTGQFDKMCRSGSAYFSISSSLSPTVQSELDGIQAEVLHPARLSASGRSETSSPHTHTHTLSFPAALK